MRDGLGFYIWVSGAPLRSKRGGVLDALFTASWPHAAEGRVMLDDQNGLKGSLNYTSARR
jgi:hypothetical protein